MSDDARDDTVLRWRDGVTTPATDTLAVEEPLTISVDGARWLTTAIPGASSRRNASAGPAPSARVSPEVMQMSAKSTLARSARVASSST